jgi:hypothetical protein
MYIVKRVTRVFSGLAIAGILIMGCEKAPDGPAPYVCTHLLHNQLVLVLPGPGSVPLAPAISLDSLKALIITDATAQALVNMPEYADPLPLASIGKIIFQ